MAGDDFAFPWARTYGPEQLAAFIEDLWGATSGANDLTTLDAIEKVIATHRPHPDCPLTRRQLDVLTGAANGEHAWDTARRLGLRDTGVHGHRERAFRRLGVRTLSQAVAACVARGWIRGEDLRTTVPSRVRVHRGQRYRDAAALLRRQPGAWHLVATYGTTGMARAAACRIRSATLVAFRPRGAYEAYHVTEADAAGRETYTVHARYVGIPDHRAQKAAS